MRRWEQSARVRSTLGASASQLQWRDIVDGQQIVLVKLAGDGSETDSLVARLALHETTQAIQSQESSDTGPFHLFLNDFHSYSSIVEAQASVLFRQLRYRAKLHLFTHTEMSRAVKDLFCSHRMVLSHGAPMGLAAERTVTYRHPTEKLQPGCFLVQPHPSSPAIELRIINTAKAWSYLLSAYQQGTTREPRPVGEQATHMGTLTERISEHISR